MDHPVLGRLIWSADIDQWRGSCALRPGTEVEIGISIRRDVSPDLEPQAILDSGMEMLEWARRIEPACRERIADELFELYQDTWAPGAPESAVIAKDRTEFMKRLVPSSLSRDINGSGFFYWGDDGMFGNHWIEVRFNKDFSITEIGLAG